MSLTIKEDLDKKLWTEFISRHPLATIFHDLDWLQILEEAYAVKILRLGFYQGKRLVGVMPLAFQNKNIFKLAGSPLSRMSTQYQGFLIDYDIALSDVLAALDEFQQKFKIDYLQFYFNEKLSGAILEKYGYTMEICKTYTLDLKKKRAALWSALSKSCRQSVCKAARMGIEVVEAENLEDWLEDYWFMINQLYSLQNMAPPDPKEFYSIIWRKLYPKNKIKVFLAKTGDKIIAGSIILFFKDRAYGLDGASLREYKSMGVNNALEWHFLEWKDGKSLQEYDLLGANIPGIARFKKSFGGNLREYTYAYRANNIMSKLGRSAYEIVSPLYRSLKKSLLS